MKKAILSIFAIAMTGGVVHAADGSHHGGLCRVQIREGVYLSGDCGAEGVSCSPTSSSCSISGIGTGTHDGTPMKVEDDVRMRDPVKPAPKPAAQAKPKAKPN